MIADQKKLPTSLIILFILTLLGNLWILIKSLVFFLNIEVENEHAQLVIEFIYILKFTACFGTILGASLMLFQKMKGYYLYLFSNILYILLVIVFVFFSFLIPYIFIVGFLHIFYVLPPILFIILYSVNIKHLN